jgi:hypothetical protein
MPSPLLLVYLMSVKHDYSGLILKSDPDTVQKSNFLADLTVPSENLGIL